MKLWILVFSLALFAGGTCLGVALQPKIAPVPRTAPESPSASWGRQGELSVQRFADRLELSGEQDFELDKILEENQQEMAALGRAMRSAHDRCRERITKILTPDQAAQLEALKAEERRARDLREVERSLGAWTKPLALSPEQAEGLKKALFDSKEKKRGYFGERRHDGDHAKVREFLRGVRTEQNKAVEKVLKADQYALYLELSEHER